MKPSFAKCVIISLFGATIFGSCQKDQPAIHAVNPLNAGDTSLSSSIICDTSRPVVRATLTPVGSLSSARTNMSAASAGNKILFIGGMHAGQNWWNEPVPADIYDISSNTWSVHWLVPDDPQSTHFRFGAAIASVGNKILFAGGGDGMGDNQSAKVDIYDASSNTWSSAKLSAERQSLSAAALGNKVFFAGGFGYPDARNWDYFNTVDIYDDMNHSWSTAALSQGRMNINATAVGNRIYFAGGSFGGYASNAIDIYDATTNSWSISSLKKPRTGMASIAAGGKIFWAGGFSAFNNGGGLYNDNVEILDLNTGVTTSECIEPRSDFAAIKINDKIVFFTGSNGSDGQQFEIYDTASHLWSSGRLNKEVRGAAIIAVNNTVYVAGGIVNGSYSSRVWKLEF